VGSFLPEIEIWNVDSEACEPAAVLGGAGKSKIVQSFEDSHSEAVLSLSLNPI